MVGRSLLTLAIENEPVKEEKMKVRLQFRTREEFKLPI